MRSRCQENQKKKSFCEGKRIIVLNSGELSHFMRIKKCPLE